MTTALLNRFVLVFSLFLISFGASAQITKQETIVYGPKVLKPGVLQSQKYLVNLPARVDATTTYKLKMVNADGANHDLVTCNQKSLLLKLSCVLRNIANEVYVLLYRVKDLSVTVNGVKVGSLNQKSAEVTLALTLKPQNQIEFKVTGSFFSFATVSLIEISNKDTLPPLLSGISPQGGESFRTLGINVSGRSNEKLSKVLVDNKPAALSVDGLSFTLKMTYSSYGSRNIIIQAYDLVGNVSQKIIPITLLANLPPVAQTSVDAADFIAAATINFSALSSYDVDGTISSYAWDFGDGTSASGSIVDHIYNNAGTYLVSLTVTDDQGLTNKTTARVVVVPNQMPLAAFKVDHALGNTPFTVQFDAEESKDADGSIVSYVWNFSDGDSITTTEPKVSHTYTMNGPYSVLLTVIDNKGGSGVATTELFANSLPVPKFSSVSSGSNYQFNASETTDADDEELSYQWSFGDGSSGSGKTIEHVYSSPGTYTVTLVVSDRISNVSVTAQVYIADPNEEQEDDSSEPGSAGFLTLLNDADKKFNSINETVVFQLEGAQLSLDKSNVSIEVNGEFVSENLFSVTSQQLIVSQFLNAGLNQVKVSAIDTEGLPVEDEFEIWAGEKNVAVNAVDQDGNFVSGLVLKYQLGSNEEVAGTSSNRFALNLPNENIVIYAQDSLGRGGVGLLKKSDTIITVQLWENEQPIEQAEDNFANGIGVWKVAADSHQIIQVPNSTEKRLQASSVSNIRLSKTIKPKIDTKSLTLNLNMTSSNPEDVYALVFRNKTTGEVKIFNDTLKNFGFSPEDGVSFSGKAAKYFTMRDGSANAEVSVYVLDSGSQILTARSAKAAASATSIKSVDINDATESKLCIESLGIYDWTPDQDSIETEAPGKFDPVFVIKNLKLQYISVGKIPLTYGAGKNKIKIFVESCEPNSNLKIKANSLGRSLGQANFAPDDLLKTPNSKVMNYSALIDLNQAETLGVKNLEVIGETLKTQSNRSRIDLSFSITQDDEEVEEVWYSKNFEYLTRSDFSQRYSLRDDSTDGKNQDEGGDDWAKPWALEYISEILNFDNSIKFNDISNMNGGYTPEHTAHRNGNLVDMIFYGLYAGHKGKKEKTWPKSQSTEHLAIIDRLISLHEQPSLLKHIGNTIITHEIPMNGANADLTKTEYLDGKIAWNRIRHNCLPDGRYAKSVIRRDNTEKPPVHGNHFHVELTNALAVSPKPSGFIDLKIRFNPRPSVAMDNGYQKIEFSEEIFKENSAGESYEVFYEKEVTATDIDGQTKSYQEFVPLTKEERMNIPYGKHKMKIVKVKRYKKDEDGRGKSNFTCHYNFESTNPENSMDEGPSDFWMTIKPEGNCNGEFLKPMLVNAKLFKNDPDGEDVAFVSPNAQIDSTSTVGRNAYACAGTILKDHSILFGNELGHVEVSNSEISGRSWVTGSVIIANSFLDHTEIHAKMAQSEEKLLDASDFSKMNYVTTVNRLKESGDPEAVPPIFLSGNTKIEGSASQKVLIEKTVPIPAIGYGPYIIINTGQLQIGPGVEIYDTDILIPKSSFTNPSDSKNKIEISGNSILRGGSVRVVESSDKFSQIYLKNTQANQSSIYTKGVQEPYLIMNIENSILNAATISSANVSNSLVDYSSIDLSYVNNSKLYSSRISYTTVNNSELYASGSLESTINSCKLFEYSASKKSLTNMYCYYDRNLGRHICEPLTTPIP